MLTFLKNIQCSYNSGEIVCLASLFLQNQPSHNDFYSQYHAEHHEDVPQGDEYPEVPEAKQKLSDVVA